MQGCCRILPRTLRVYCNTAGANAFPAKVQYNDIAVQKSNGGPTAILEVANLECVRGDRRLFRDVSFSCDARHVCATYRAERQRQDKFAAHHLRIDDAGERRDTWQGAKIRSLAEEYSRSITYIGHRNGVKEELSSLENLRIASGLAGIRASRRRGAGRLSQQLGLGRPGKLAGAVFV